ncbi:MAG: hypothetical protein IJ513_03465 [Bacteroidaceae bacterium]|nr:hypothetical protein [Bacteroidaceae bacterium]
MKKVFKKRVSAWILCTSVFVNVSLLGVAAFYEFRTHEVQIILSDLGLCNIEDRLRPDFWCIQGWTSCVRKLNYKADIAFMGNSITAGSDFQRYFIDKKIIEFGYSGDRIDGMQRRVGMLQSVNPEKIFIMGGINDLHRSSPETVAKRMESLIVCIQSSLPQTKIYVQSILPVNRIKENSYATNEIIRETNGIIERIAKEHGCNFIDLYSVYIENGALPDSLSNDGVHLKKEAYGRWANVIKPYIYE